MKCSVFCAKVEVERFGELLESEALTLHALMMSSHPYYTLIEPNTLQVISALRRFREETGHPVYFTLDAGPNVHLLYPDTIAAEARTFIRSVHPPLLRRRPISGRPRRKRTDATGGQRNVRRLIGVTLSMRYFNLVLCALSLLLFHACRLSSQDVPERLKTDYAPLDEELATLVTADSLAISAWEARDLPSAVFLDAREKEEYDVSHLPEAIRIGYDDPDYAALSGVDRAAPLVVYCTVGFRSEKIASALRKRGFSDVHNLYGSIYAWKLAGFPIVDASGPTERLHTYNKKWGSYFPDSLATKVYR